MLHSTRGAVRALRGPLPLVLLSLCTTASALSLSSAGARVCHAHSRATCTLEPKPIGRLQACGTESRKAQVHSTRLDASTALSSYETTPICSLQARAYVPAHSRVWHQPQMGLVEVNLNERTMKVRNCWLFARLTFSTYE
eukprot:1560361-Pleurochrysis_carterae.AAC.2